MKCVLALLIISAISAVRGSGICNGSECLQCIKLDHCMYIRRFRDPSLCIRRSEIHEFKFKAIISEPKKCDAGTAAIQKEHDQKDIHSSLPSSTMGPVFAVKMPTSPRIHWTTTSSLSTPAPQPAPTLSSPTETAQTILSRSDSTNGTFSTDATDIEQTKHEFLSRESSTTTKPTTASPPAQLHQLINNQSDMVWPNATRSSLSLNHAASEPADVSVLDVFSFTVPTPHDCDSSGMKAKLHYPIAIRTAFSMCRSYHLFKKLQAKTQLTKDLTEWMTTSPAHDHANHCAYLLFYKKNCGRKFA